MINSNGKKEIIRAFFWSLLSKGATYSLVLVLGNLYLISEYGKATFILAIFNITLMLSALGMPHALVPWIIKKKDYKSVFRGIFWVFAGSAILVNCLTALMVRFRGYNPELSFLVFIMAGAMFFYWANNVCASFLLSKKRYDLVNLIGAIAMVVTLILAFFLRNLLALGIVIAYFSGHFVAAIISISLERKNFWIIVKSLRLKIQSFKSYLKEGVIISLVALSFYFMGWADSTILGILSNLENVARYNIASVFANAAALIPITLGLFIISRISEVKRNKKSKEILKRVIRVSYFFTLLLAVFVSSIISLLIKIFFPQYIGVELFASILLVGAVFYSSYLIIYNYFIAKMNVRKHFFPIIFAGVLNIVLDILLIPYLGILGVCIATVFAHFVVFILLSKKLFKTKEILLMSLFPLLILLVYYTKYSGIFLILVSLWLLFKSNLIKTADLRVIYLELKGIFVKNKLNKFK